MILAQCQASPQQMFRVDPFTYYIQPADDPEWCLDFDFDDKKCLERAGGWAGELGLGWAVRRLECWEQLERRAVWLCGADVQLPDFVCFCKQVPAYDALQVRIHFLQLCRRQPPALAVAQLQKRTRPLPRMLSLIP